MLGRKRNAKISECATSMAGIVTDSIELESDPLDYMTRDQFAYLQGHECIEHLHIGTFGSRRLVTAFRNELIGQGLPTNEALVHMLKFWIFYWTMMAGSTEGSAQRLALKQVRRSETNLARNLAKN